MKRRVYTSLLGLSVWAIVKAEKERKQRRLDACQGLTPRIALTRFWLSPQLATSKARCVTLEIKGMVKVWDRGGAYQARTAGQ